MRKLFTLLVAAMATVTVSAQTTLFEFTGSETTGVTFTSVGESGKADFGTVAISGDKNTTVSAMVFGKTVAKNSDTGVYDYYAAITVEDGIKAGDIITIAGVISATDTTKRASAYLFTLSDDCTSKTDLYATADLVNARDADKNYLAVTPTEETFVVPEDLGTTICVGRGNGGTGVNITTLKIVRPDSETATIGSAGYATYVTKSDVSFDVDGLTAYSVAVDADGSSVTLTEIAEAPQGTAVVLKGEAGDYTLGTANNPATVDTDLQYSSSAVTADGSTYYVLANGENGVGFYLVSGSNNSDKVIAAGKGYLVISNSSAKSFIGFGDATGISNVAVEAECATGAIYNLAGQQVSESYKGVVVKNGKKYISK